MKYIYTLIITGMFLVGYLAILPTQPTARTIYATIIVAFVVCRNFVNYEQTKLNNNETKK